MGCRFQIQACARNDYDLDFDGLRDLEHGAPEEPEFDIARSAI